MQLLRQDPALMPGGDRGVHAVRAMFVTLFPRTATTAIEMSGVSFAAGETVSVSPVAANRDERVFARPDDFDITRDAFGHLGFGHGLHGCAGQQLARVEIGTAVSHLITAFPSLRSSTPISCSHSPSPTPWRPIEQARSSSAGTETEPIEHVTRWAT
jgi:cytochrome P450